MHNNYLLSIEVKATFYRFSIIANTS